MWLVADVAARYPRPGPSCVYQYIYLCIDTCRIAIVSAQQHHCLPLYTHTQPRWIFPGGAGGRARRSSDGGNYSWKQTFAKFEVLKSLLTMLNGR